MNDSGGGNCERLRVMIADDHAQVREGLTALLGRHGMDVVAEATDGAAAVELHRRHQPDLTLMDLRMPRMDGLSALRAILSEFAAARIVVLTSFDGEEQNALHAGAKALVQKDAPGKELIAVLRAVAAAR